MFFIKKTIIIFLNLVNLFLFYLILKQPSLVYYAAAGILISVALSTKLTTGQKITGWENIFVWSLGATYWLAGILFLFIIESRNIVYSLLFLIAFISFFYTQSLWRYYRTPAQYRPYTLVIFFNYLSLINVFFISVAGFAVSVFLSQNFWLIPIIMAGAITIIFLENLWLNKLPFKDYWGRTIGLFLIFSELAILLAWWPVSYFIKASLLSLGYFLINYFLLKKEKMPGAGLKWYYFLIILIIIFVILITARWY